MPRLRRWAEACCGQCGGEAVRLFFKPDRAYSCQRVFSSSSSVIVKCADMLREAVVRLREAWLERGLLQAWMAALVRRLAYRE